MVAHEGLECGDVGTNRGVLLLLQRLAARVVGDERTLADPVVAHRSAKRPTVMRRIAQALGVKDPLTVYELRVSILGDDITASTVLHDPE